MKRLLYLFLLIPGFAMAQDKNADSRIELKYGVGNVNITNNKVLGGASTHVTGFNIFGANAVFGIDRNWAFELGMSYIPLKYTLTPAAGLSQASSSEEVTFVSVPLKARYNLGKYFFLNAGLLIDFEAKNTGGIEKQSGFGANFGVGLKYDLKNGIGFFLNPEINARSLSRSKKGSIIRRIADNDINFGIAYSF